MRPNLEAGDYLICSSSEYDYHLQLIQQGRHPSYKAIEITEFNPGDDELTVFVTYASKTSYFRDASDLPPVRLELYLFPDVTADELLRIACEAYDVTKGGGYENADETRMKAAIEAVLERVLPVSEERSSKSRLEDIALVDEFVSKWIRFQELKVASYD